MDRLRVVPRFVIAVMWENDTCGLNPAWARVGVTMRSIAGLLMLTVAAALMLGCSREQPDPASHGSAATRLKPAATVPQPTLRRTVYVPVYSSIYLGLDGATVSQRPGVTVFEGSTKQHMLELSATVSVRNVSPHYGLTLNAVRYYDSTGKQVREYLNKPSELAPLASVEFVVPRTDTAGGPGANFLIEWSGRNDMDEALIESVMIGQSANAGFSFTSPGRVLKNGSPE